MASKFVGSNVTIGTLQKTLGPFGSMYMVSSLNQCLYVVAFEDNKKAFFKAI